MNQNTAHKRKLGKFNQPPGKKAAKRNWYAGKKHEYYGKQKKTDKE